MVRIRKREGLMVRLVLSISKKAPDEEQQMYVLQSQVGSELKARWSQSGENSHLRSTTWTTALWCDELLHLVISHQMC